MMLPFLLSSICTCRFRIFQVYRRGVHWVIILFVEGGGIQGSIILVVLLCEFNKFKFNPLAWSTHESFVMNMWKDKLTGAFHNHIYLCNIIIPCIFSVNVFFAFPLITLNMVKYEVFLLTMNNCDFYMNAFSNLLTFWLS